MRVISGLTTICMQTSYRLPHDSHLAREGVGIAIVNAFVISRGLTGGLAVRPLDTSPLGCLAASVREPAAPTPQCCVRSTAAAPPSRQRASSASPSLPSARSSPAARPASALPSSSVGRAPAPRPQAGAFLQAMGAVEVEWRTRPFRPRAIPLCRRLLLPSSRHHRWVHLPERYAVTKHTVTY